ncbi:MAG: ribosome-associated translation inhibitor RaiA [bacterium]|jgi:putative sigma-54 modulation protein|nr:ribosome-associated translation inhibitor RaiA [bacterium]
MKLQMHSIHFDADIKLLDFIQKKADKLETFFDRIIDGEVFMRLEKGEARENKIVEIKINIPGNQLFAKVQSSSFEAAADEAVEALRRQLKKHKEKLYEHH